jgi:DNA-binding PadR family transcriptional regulator
MASAAGCWAGEDFGGLSELLKSLSDLASQVQKGIKAMASNRARGGPWERDFTAGWGGKRGAGHWGGGFVGPKGGWWPGPPGPPHTPRPPKASRGDVRAAILALLKEGARNGYQIMSDIEERSHGAWRPSPGAVYPALSQLADEGLIIGEESGGSRAYRLTEAGHEYVQQNPEMARGAWESQEQQDAWEVPGLFAEAARLGAGIVQIAHAGSPDQVRAAERLLQRTRRELYRILAEANTMDDRMRVSDADREQVTARLREHFAEGRLTQDELDERITAALSAKTFGDLRRIMHDLPEPEPAGAGPGNAPPSWAGPGPGPGFYRYRRGPRLLPIALLVLFLLFVMGPGGWFIFGFVKILLLFWLILAIAGLFTAMRFKRHVRRNWQSTYGEWWRNQNWPRQ